MADVVEGERSLCRRDIVWETNFEPVAEVRGNDAHLRLMLSHLIRNALEALPLQGGTIRFSTSTDSRGWIVLEIGDDGQGMDNATLQRAVEPFFSTRPGHLGIGLSVANGIWRRHRGTLTILSHVGEGTRIRLCIEPVHKRA